MLTLPPEILLPIIRHSLALSPALALPFLTQLGTEFSNLTLAVEFAQLALPDDDTVLWEAEQAQSSSDSRLSAIYENDHKANLVKSLAIHAQSTPDVPPLEDTSFLLLLAKLPHLTNFTFSSPRLPPSNLCRALARTAKSLSHFKIDLSPRCQNSQPASNSSNHVDSAPTATTGDGATKLRWDAEGISALPGGLLSLSISNLSSTGATNLANAFTASSFPELDRLELQRTAFVDDTLLQAVAEGAMKLTTLRILDMSGTKLTGEGLRGIFENDEITELVLDNVQGRYEADQLDHKANSSIAPTGRFSKSCWKKLSPLPTSLTRIKISYSEEGSHHTWITDHLDSLSYIVSCPSLRSLSVTRQQGSERDSSPVSGAISLRPLPSGIVEALVEKGEDWEELELDFFQMSLLELKAIMDSATNLLRLQILLCAPFKTMLTLTSSFALTTHLRSVVVTVDPRHLSHLITTIPFASLALSSSPPTTTPTKPISESLSSRTANSAYSPPSSLYSTSPTSSRKASSPKVTGEGDVLPLAKEWRRFLKKTQRLEEIVWTGRGGLGTWYVSRAGAAVKVDFVGVGETVSREVKEEGGTNGESENGAGGRRRSSARRTSSVSLAGSTLANFLESCDSALDDQIERPDGIGGEQSVAGLGIEGSSPVSSRSSHHTSRRRSSATSASTAASSIAPMHDKSFPPLAPTKSDPTPSHSSPFSLKISSTTSPSTGTSSRNAPSSSPSVIAPVSPKAKHSRTKSLSPQISQSSRIGSQANGEAAGLPKRGANGEKEKKAPKSRK